MEIRDVSTSTFLWVVICRCRHLHYLTHSLQCRTTGGSRISQGGVWCANVLFGIFYRQLPKMKNNRTDRGTLWYFQCTSWDNQCGHVIIYSSVTRLWKKWCNMQTLMKLGSALIRMKREGIYLKQKRVLKLKQNKWWKKMSFFLLRVPNTQHKDG